MRLLIEQRALAHHLDRAGAPRIEDQSETALEQVADARIGQKSFLLAAGESRQPFRFAEPAGDLGCCRR